MCRTSSISNPALVIFWAADRQWHNASVWCLNTCIPDSRKCSSSITVVATRLAREKSFNGWFDGAVRASREYGNKDYKKNLKARQKHGDAGMFEHCLVFRNTVINHLSIFKKQEEKRLITWNVEWRCPGTKEAAVAVPETSGNSVELAAQLSKQKTYDDDDDNDDTRLLEAQKGFFPARTT